MLGSIRSTSARVLCAALLGSVLAAPAAAASFQGWAPLGDYERTALREGSAFRITLPTRTGNLDVAFQPRGVEAAGYHAEALDARGRSQGQGRPAVSAWTGAVASENPRDFAKLAHRPRHGGAVSGLLRADGVLYDLSAELARGDLLLVVREITPAELGALLEGCGVTAEEALAVLAGEGSSGEEPGSAAAGALREVELGTEADAPFVAQNGSVDAANAKILSIVNAVNGIYETDLGLTNRVAVQRAWSGSDPYTSSDSGTLLSEFRSNFGANVATVYDDAQLFSGRDFESSVVGRAWISATCGSYRYGVNQYYQQSESLTRLIVAHEEGHNLGGNHSTDGIMAPSINASVTWFSAASKSEIGNYVAGVSCLANVSVGQPPALDPVGPQTIAEGATLSLQLTASDPDGDALSFGATPLPVGASITTQGLFSYLPPANVAGCGGTKNLNVEFFVTDTGGHRTSEIVPISVLDQPTGATPVLLDPADRTVNAGQLVSIQLSASDADGDTLGYSASGLPSGASLSGAGLFSWTPTNAAAGTTVVSFTATDCTGRAASQSVSITVNPVLPPHLASLSPSTGASGTSVTITGVRFAGSSVAVYFGSKAATISSKTDTALVVKAPRQAKGVTSVGVSVTRDGLASDNALTFTYGSSTGGGGGKGKGKP
jgi:hypothetical protein